MKKENLSASMPKLIMTVTLIVCIGAVLGLTAEVMKNKRVVISQPQVSVVPEATDAPVVKDETADLSSKALATEVWKTYRDEEYGFEAKFPSDLILQKNTGESYISFEGKLADKSYFLQFGYISQSALNRMGINYCGVYLGDDSRCENFTINNLKFLIDWNIETEGAFTQSRAEVLKSEGGIIAISILHSPSQDIKLFFKQILSTFKFTGKDEAADWKTFKNSEYEISYPADWNRDEEYNPEIFGDRVITNMNNTGEWISIRKFKLEKNQSFKDILVLNTVLGESGDVHPNFFDFELEKVGNNNFYYIFPYLSEGQYSVSYWYVNGSSIIQFELYSLASGDWQSDSWQVENQPMFKTFNQILSTFKFTEK